MNSKTGTLYIVATPIGNLGDMTFRAVETLKQADLIVAEDTRHASILLHHYQIDRPIWSCHEHNERKQLGAIIEKLQTGQSVALVSDAGTPLINDPGFLLVQAAKSENIEVVPIPGPCAVIAALSACGLAVNRFCFEGFLPAKSGQRTEFLQERVLETRTMVFYESSHRIVASLHAFSAVFGHERQIVVAREITKKFEQFIHGEVIDVIATVEENPLHQKGEFVIVLAGAKAGNNDQQAAIDLLKLLLQELPTKKATKIAAEWLGQPRNKLYELALSLKDN